MWQQDFLLQLILVLWEVPLLIVLKRLQRQQLQQWQ